MKKKPINLHFLRVEMRHKLSLMLYLFCLLGMIDEDNLVSGPHMKLDLGFPPAGCWVLG